MNDLPDTINYNVLDMVFRSWLCTDRCFSEAAGAGDLHQLSGSCFQPA